MERARLHSVVMAKLICVFLMHLGMDGVKEYTVMKICVLSAEAEERIPLIPHECYNWHLIALGPNALCDFLGVIFD